MNDLMDVRGALGEPGPPSHTAYSAARTALLREAAAARAAAAPAPAPAPAPPGQPRLAVADRGTDQAPRPGRPHRHRSRWLAGSLGLTAAAVTAVAAVMTAGTPGATGGHPGNSHAGPVSRLSARQILLAAATSAATARTRTGAYWYIKQTGPGPAAGTTTRAWYTHDGTEYDPTLNGKGVYLSSWGGFGVGGSQLTYRQIQHLPTDPAALTAWIRRSFYHPSVAVKTPPPGAPKFPAPPPVAKFTPPPRAAIPSEVAFSLSDLLGQVPAPPALRAAAFRALAAMPDVTKAGQADGNVTLRVSFPVDANKWPAGKVPRGAGEIRLTIGTSTLAVRALANYQGTMTILAARWTNSRPPVRPLSQAP